MIATLEKKVEITPRDTLYTFICPEIAKKAKPGQFVEVKLSQLSDPFLRRPISIFDSDNKEKFSLLVRTVGKGTKYFTTIECGTELDIIGPLGNSFNIDDESNVCLLAGGGIGAAPLNFLASTLIDMGKKVIFLYSPKRDSNVLSAFPRLNEFELYVAKNREDARILANELVPKTDCVYSCGPDGFLETIADTSDGCSKPCQLSMESHMGCGFGICVCCAIAIYTKDGLTYKKVCQDGPIFSSKEVSFHEKP